MPGTPGRRAQAPRTIRSIRTPACEAAYSARMMRGSLIALILAMMRAGLPAFASLASRSIFLIRPGCRVKGDCSRRLSLVVGASPDNCWNSRCTSLPMSGSAVIRPMSVYARAVPLW